MVFISVEFTQSTQVLVMKLEVLFLASWQKFQNIQDSTETVF